VVLSGRLQAVLQATVGNGLSFDPLSFGQDSRAAPAVDVGGGEIVDAFVVSTVVKLRREAMRACLVGGVGDFGNPGKIRNNREHSSSMTTRPPRRQIRRH